MILQRLKIKNYGRFANVDIDLEGIKLASIVGTYSTDERRSNGSGKSTLLESIRYVLFGIANTTRSEGVIRRHTTECEVELTLLFKGNTLKVLRGRSTNGTSIAKFWVNGQPAGDGTKIVNAQVEKYLSIDGELFDLVYFFRQDNQATFVTATPGERKAFFARIFNLTHYQRCEAYAKSLRQDAAKELDETIGTIKVLEQERNLLGDIKKVEADLEKAEDDCDEYLHQLCINKYYAHSLIFDERELQKQLVEFDRDLSDKTTHLKFLENAIQNNLHALTQKNAELVQFRPLMNSRIAAVAELDKQIEAITADPNKDYDAELNIAQREDKQLQREISALDMQIQNLTAILSKTMTLRTDQCPTCLQPITKEYLTKVSGTYTGVFNDANAKLVALNGKLKEVVANIDWLSNCHAALKNKKHLLQHREDQNNMLNDARRNVVRLKAEADKIKEELDKDQQTVTILSAELNGVDANVVRANITNAQAALNTIINLTKSRSEKISSQINECERKMVAIDGIFLNWNRLTKRLVSATAKANELKKAINMYDILINIFGKNGLQALMIENIVHVIEGYANDILKEMQTTFSIQLSTQRETQAGKEKETLDIIVFDKGYPQVFELYSGAERMMLNVALRVALSKVIGNFYGTHIGGLFLDEVLGSLDEVNREIAIKVLSYLSAEFNQVFVVTHTPEIRDMISDRITVKRYEDYSTVEVNDGRSRSKAG